MKPYTVININKKGEVFNPAEYIVRRAENPELYKFLEDVSNEKNKANADR